jgi:hypothetical protein
MVTGQNYQRIKTMLKDDKHVTEVKRLLGHPLTRLLLVIVLVLALVYASKYIFNSTAHSANAFKNLRDAMAR